jgi:hypothetical protein
MRPEKFTIEPLAICGGYNKQRFVQFGPEDAANFYLVKSPNTKSEMAMFPTMGRQHINFGGLNQLIFGSQPRFIFNSKKYWYAIVGNAVFRVDKNFTVVNITGSNYISGGGKVFFTYLVVSNITFACFTDQEKIYIYQEDSGTLQVVTDIHAPGNITNADGSVILPGYIAAFGNRIVVSGLNSSYFYLSIPNLGGSTFSISGCFTNAVPNLSVFAQEIGVIEQFAVLKNTLYIFTEFTTGIWSNIPSLSPTGNILLPWKKNTTSDWNVGMADDLSLNVGFGIMAFLAQNNNGLLQVMASSGGPPKSISNKGIDVLFQKYANSFDNGGPFLSNSSNGFLYQYENTIFYRLSAGNYNDYGILDQQQSANSIEYNFETNSWHRCIEANGERNRIQQHIYFNNRHLVIVEGENTVYEMSGSFYTNELHNTAQADYQESDAYIKYPFRYERVTPIVAYRDQGEFQTNFVQIDMVFGESDISYTDGGFANTVYIIDEVKQSGEDVYLITDESTSSDPTYIIAEEGNTPILGEKIYNKEFNPHVELYFSNDGGNTYNPADVLEFSQQGQYEWRMRWYQLGVSRNRAYKLVIVSSVPAVVMSAVMETKRVGNNGE